MPENKERGLPPVAYLVYSSVEEGQGAMEALGEEVEADGLTG